MSSFINFNNKEIATEANYSAEVIKIALLKSETKSSPKAEMLVKNVKEPVSLNEALVFFTDKLSAMKSLSNAIIEVNEGRVKQFEMDYASMVKEIKKGYGWIDPEYVADTWENSSDSIGFDLVRDEIFDRLIAAGLLAHADSNNPEKAGKYVKSAKDLYVMESEEVNETLFYAFFNNKKIEVEGKDLWDAKQKAIIELKVPKSKVGLLAVVSAESQKNQDFRFESVVTEGKSAGLSKEETLKVAQKFADALAKVDGVKVTVSKGHEEDSFDLDYDGEEFAGGSYNIYKNGDVVNMAVPNYAVYGKMDDDIKTIIKNINKVSNESVITEADNTEILDLVDHIHEIIKDLKEDSTKDSKKTSKLFNDSKPLIARLHSLVEGLTNEGKADYMARYKDTNINLKKAYNHLNDEELNQLYLEIGELIADNKLKVKDATFTFESATNEAFYRMSSDTVGNELYTASQDLTAYYDWLQAGNDSGQGKTLDGIIDLLKKCKNNIQKFNKPEEVKGTTYESIVTEGRSINKIQKDWSQTTTDMQQKVVDWKEAEGDRKIEILEELKSLTAKKKQLESELESAVAGKDKDVQLAISEDHTADPNDVYEVKPCAIEGTPWSVWEGDVRVECFATEEEAQAFADKQNKEQGLANVEEGNAFGAARAEAIAKGEKEFEVDGETFKVEDVDKEDKENAEEFVEEATVTEAKFDKKKLMKAVTGDDGIISTGDGKEYVIYKYGNGNDDNDAMWNDKSIFALDQDGEEHEIEYSDIVRYDESIKPSWDNLLEEFEMVEITNEDLRTEIKKFIKKNNEELDEFADNDNWDAMYQKLYDEFGVEADSAKGKDLLKTFQFVY